MLSVKIAGLIDDRGILLMSMFRQLLDGIDGFTMFLSAVDGDRLNRTTPPVMPVAKTPQLFEKYLSYALALGVEHADEE